MRECGDCQLCCQLIGTSEYPKLPNNKCKHQCISGCAIYNDRPQNCKDYSCKWLLDDNIPEEYRPDKIGCVIDVHTTPLGLAVVCYQSIPNMWSKEPVKTTLRNLAEYYNCFIYVVYKGERAAIFPEWASEQQESFDKMVKDDKINELLGSNIHG